jgi:hypothetical protein
MNKKWPFSLSLLPIDGILDPTMTVEMARGRLVNTLHIIDGILRIPSGLPGDLKQAIHNVRFHVISGIGLIDGMLQLGYAMQQPASDVEGLYASIDNHILEIQKSKILWNSWLRDETNQGYGGFLDEASKPGTTGDYLAAAGVYGASRIPMMFGGMLDRPSLFHDATDTVNKIDLNVLAIAGLIAVGGLIILGKGK